MGSERDGRGTGSERDERARAACDAPYLHAFEEAALLVGSAEGRTLLPIEDDDLAHLAVEDVEAVRKPADERPARGAVARRRPPSLELPALEAAKVQVRRTVVVHEDRRVDARRAAQRTSVGRVRPRRARCVGHPDLERPAGVLGAKEQVVLPVGRACKLGCPQLLPRPGHAW